MSLVGLRAKNHPQQAVNPDVDDRATTWDHFGVFNDRFDFTIDVAAADHNAKCDRYFTEAQDGLAQPWASERVWCNPPYSNIRPWLQKAWEEWRAGAELIVMLLPANRTEQAWWQDLVEPQARARVPWFTVEFLPGRLRFLRRDQSFISANERPPFGCCLLIWGDA